MTEFLTREIKSAGAGSTFLAIDSSLGSSVAVSNNKEIFEVRSADPMGHAEIIAELIERALKNAGLKPQDIDVVIGGAGPGPFTGLRVGLAAAEAFAFGVGAQYKKLNSHDASALEAYESGFKDQILVVGDAKRKELFVSEYGGLDEDQIPIRVSGPDVIAQGEFSNLDSSAGDFEPTVFSPVEVSAAHLVLLAERITSSGRDFYEGGALYLRQPDVNLTAAAVKMPGAADAGKGVNGG